MQKVYKIIKRKSQEQHACFVCQRGFTSIDETEACLQMVQMSLLVYMTWIQDKEKKYWHDDRNNQILFLFSLFFLSVLFIYLSSINMCMHIYVLYELFDDLDTKQNWKVFPRW